MSEIEQAQAVIENARKQRMQDLQEELRRWLEANQCELRAVPQFVQDEFGRHYIVAVPQLFVK